jgi:hypothetical protein
MELSKTELERLNDILKTVDYGKVIITIGTNRNELNIEVNRNLRIPLDKK